MEELCNRIVANDDYKEIVEKGNPWTDSTFPHDNSVLEGIEGKYNWLRASQIFHGKEKVYDSFSGDDIEQGGLGDCYLLSAISALAEFPERVEKLFIQKERNSAGCYVVRLYICGQQVEIVLDDYFPVDPFKRPAFAGSKGRELWVMLIEKAWAKIHGNFSRIEGGDSRESLAAITGAPVYYHRHSDMKPEELWQMLKEADRANYVMCTGASKDTQGIIRAHAYTLINAYEFKLNEKDVKLLQIRNPWGCTEWEGEWSDKDPKWTPEMNRKLNHTSKDDGTFFIPFEDFSQIFIHTFVAKVHDDYLYSNLLIKDEKAFAAFSLTRETKGFVSAYQLTKRLGSSIFKDYSVKHLRIELYRLDGDSLSLVQHAWNNAVGPAHLEVCLSPGKYVVKAVYTTKPELPYITFVGYADKKIDFIELKINDLREATSEKIHEELSTLKAAYDSKTSAAKLAGAFHTCLLGHKLEWSTVPSETGEMYLCENCRRPNKASNGRWLCQPCLYDICTKCKPKELSTVEKDAKTVKCSMGHAMTFGPSEEKSSLYLCDKCGKAYFGVVDRWKCDICQMDLCRACVPPPPEFKDEGKIPEIDTCARNHRLEFIVTETPNGRYECDICTKVGDAHNGRWACLKCGVNVCHICKPCDKAKKGVVNAKTKTLVCSKGHMLMFTCYPPTAGLAIYCDKCKGRVQPDNWRWNCRICEFDVCVKCRPEPEGRRDIICPNMHKLAYSTLPKGVATFGRCDICRRVFKLVNGRYCCLACKYECCKNCELALSNSKQGEVMEKSMPRNVSEGEKTDAEPASEKDKAKEKREGCCCTIL